MGEFEDKEVATDRDADLPIPDILPVLPLKDVVVFPYIILPLSVSREKSINAVDAALAEQRIIMLVAQRDGQNDTPRPDELYTVGTVAAIMRMLKLPDGRIRLLVQGLSRARLDSVLAEEPYIKAKITRLEESPSPEELPPEHEALLRSVKQNLEKSVSLGKNISPEVMVIAGNLDDPARLADLAASNLDLKLEDAQKILESTDAIERLRLVNDSLAKEITVLTMQQEISTQARGEMDKSQREYYLRQQLRAIQQELGEGEEISEELDAYRKIIADKKIPQEAATEIEKQIKRLERSHPDSAETAIIRTYLDWMTGLPWSNASEDSKDIERARKILDEDHYDIEKVKERILEFLAVHALKQSLKGPILCFVGPPGVGKTSLGRSIARALDRKFVRLSLGGVRDEAEIRGHRRTYVGAMPGRIIQGIHQAGTSNPVFMMDEIDKIGADYRGDPSAALLEVFDPEQNFSFRDHYLSVPYDLSKVLFIATANVLDPIQPAFLDRMEVIRLSGYTVEEKKAIARRHLIPKQMEENGVTEANIEFTDSGIEKVIEGYTREAGLRNLEREIGALCRKVAVSVAKGKQRRYRIGAASLEKMLGPVKHFRDEQLKKDEVGVATGLAWTSVGGDILFIEALAVRGKGGLRLTGQLGDVMKESAQAAMSYARAHAADLKIPHDFFETHDVHVHVPEGGIPKDGPSAGITMATAMISAFTQRKARRDVAMTGEITLRGEVLPIGGVKEKVLAARAAKITTIVLPKMNRRDITQITPRILHGLTFRYVESMDEVLGIALLPQDPETGSPEATDARPPETPGREIPVTAPRTPESAARAARVKAEDRFVEKLRALLPGSGAVLGPGDDAAIVRRAEGLLAATTDLLVEGIDFLPGEDPERLGRRAAAVNLSDLAAMGALPEFFLLAIGFPPGKGEDFPLAIARGAIARAGEFGAHLVGGDLSAAPQTVISVALWGTPAGAPLTRSGASAGDGVYISGHPGQAAAGLRLARASVAGVAPEEERILRAAFHDPAPRIALGAELARHGLASAAIDVSDGLGIDAARLARASGVRLVLDREALPVSAALQSFASRAGLDPLDLVLGGGDDYELLFTVPAPAQERLERHAGAFGVSVTRIGRAEEGAGAVLSGGGALRDVAGFGHDHLETPR